MQAASGRFYPWMVLQKRGYPCCHGLGLPPPDRIVITYDPDEVDRYIEIADALEDEFADIKVEGVAGSKGQFQVSGGDGKLLITRTPEEASSSIWPKTEEIMAMLKDMESNACKL